MTRLLVLASVVAAGLLALPAAGAPAQTPPDEFSFSFTTARAGAPAGFNLEGEFRRQRVLYQVVFTLPRGTRLHPGAARRCRATIEQIDDTMAQTPNGIRGLCPAESRIGTGAATVLLGDSPTPIPFELELYNWTGRRILVDIRGDGTSAFVSAMDIEGRRLVLDLSLAPQINSRVSAFEMSVRRAGTRRRPYVRTPVACPRARRIAAAMTAREAFIGGSVTTRDTTTCRRAR